MIKITNGRAVAVVIEATDTYLVIQKTSIQIAAPITIASGICPKSAPAEVATPFPPRNLSQGGKECPITADTAPSTAYISAEPHSGFACVAIAVEIVTATKPFRKSNTKTG